MKIAIFCDTNWSIGQLYRSVAHHIGADLIEWSRSTFPPGIFSQYDRILTLPMDGVRYLTGCGIPRSKILVCLHAEHDLIQVFKEDPQYAAYAGLGAVSDSLVSSALTLGLTRIPTVLRQGIDVHAYTMPMPAQLRVVGYAANMERMNQYGTVEIKRGALARAAAARAGLDFKIALGLERAQMPAFYASVDALVMSSLQEGGAMPPYEAAASGRLVIGTPVGDFPQLCLAGMGILAPLNEERFVPFVANTLLHYCRDVGAFRAKCASIRAAVRATRTWENVIEDWRSFTGSTGTPGTGIIIGRDSLDPRVFSPPALGERP
jgi:hypothetical protein